MNPPIEGHELINEGAVYYRANRYGEFRYFGGCRCGEQPGGIGSMSKNAMKHWHRQHKADLRAAPGEPQP